MTALVVVLQSMHVWWNPAQAYTICLEDPRVLEACA